MARGPKTGRLMMGCWLRREPKIVEVLGMTEDGNYFVRDANTDTITGCRDENLHEYDTKEFAVRRHDWAIQECKRRQQYHEGELMEAMSGIHEKRLKETLEMLEEARNTPPSDVRFAEGEDDA